MKGNKDDFASKHLCFPDRGTNPKEECLYLLDGQQRISSLKNIFTDYYKDPTTWEINWQEIYSDLRVRWFFRIKPKNEYEEDLFGYQKLSFTDIRTLEPNAIIERIEPKKIYKTKVNEWYHPLFKLKDKDSRLMLQHKRKNEIAKEAAQNGLVPLYSIYDSYSSQDKPLHSYVIEKIAEERLNELKAEVADGSLNIIEILEFIEPDIEDAVNNNDQNVISKAWDKLSAKWSESVISFLGSILNQDIHTIELPSSDIGRAVSIFENINRGGIPLDTYDLIVAKSARDKNLPSLTKRIIERLKGDIQIPQSVMQNIIGIAEGYNWNCGNFGAVSDNSIANLIKNQYLNLLSIYSYFDESNISQLRVDYIKKSKILDINYSTINTNTDCVIKSLIRACAFLHFRCGVVSVNDLTYELMILPIAYTLQDDDVWGNTNCINKIEYWYWSSLFGGSYRQYQNQQCIDDVKALYLWVKGGQDSFKSRYDKILDDSGYSDKDLLLMKDKEDIIPSAIYNGILQYVLSTQPLDFLPNKVIRLNTWDIVKKTQFIYNDTPYTLSIEDHHIYPLYGAKKLLESTKELRNDKKQILNSPLNRTYISSLANNIIREKSPAEYLNYVSSMAQWKHCVPTTFKSDYSLKTGETKEDFYRRLLENRYDELLKTIKMELDSFGF